MRKIRFLKGFGLIEILVAIFVVAFGVLAVGKLQTYIISTSSDNKAKLEAMSLAQGQIEHIKSYYLQQDASSEIISASTFIDDYIGKPPSIPNTTVVGTYATFTVGQSFTSDSDIAIANVTVSWSDSSGASQSVNLNTEFTFTNLAASGSGAIPNDTNFIEAPTGRAHLGDGTISTDDEHMIDNKDGTSIYADGDQLGDENVDLLLAVGDQVVLTLEDACVIASEPDYQETINNFSGTDYQCTDFVRIEGRVYFNDSYKIGNGGGAQTITDISPLEFFVLASDAAYCSRSKEIIAPDPYGVTELLKDGVYTSFENIESLTISDLPSETYNKTDSKEGKQYYFNYICYIGGGWHGNIGLVTSNESLNESGLEACVGDPNDGSLDTVEFALRRSYRGMIWRSANTDTFEPTLKDDGNIKYYSWGVADASEIGGNDVYNHDFLVVADSADCDDPDIMDTTTFATNVDDFFCLNEITTKASGLVDPDTDGLIASAYGAASDFDTEISSIDRTNLDERNLDPDRDGIYENPDLVGYYDYCPYDPTNPPYFFHSGVGLVSISNITSQDDNDNLVDSIFIKTSQGDTCQLSAEGATWASSTSSSSISYSCTLYDSGEIQGSKLVETVVDGVVAIFDNGTNDISIVCPTSYFSFSDNTGWAVGEGFDFTCSASSGSGSSLVAVEDTFSFTRNTEYTINAVTQLVANDYGGSGGLTFGGLTNTSSSSGFLTNNEGTLTYKYTENFAGNNTTDTYYYIVEDSEGTTATGSITITVTKN